MRALEDAAPNPRPFRERGLARGGSMSAGQFGIDPLIVLRRRFGFSNNGLGFRLRVELGQGFPDRPQRGGERIGLGRELAARIDRKSTRLNSSHIPLSR